MFGDRSVDQIDVLKALNSVWLTKPETARRLRQRMRMVFEWARASGFRSGDNPADGISRVLPKQPTTRHHHAALPYQEVPAFIRALREADAAETVRLAFEFMILTATRTSEALNATWDEFDVEKKSWHILLPG